MENTRYKILQKFLNDEKCFKLICGAGNEDKIQVKKLAFIYTLAGAKILDISANVDVVKAAVEGIDLAFNYASKLDITLITRPFIMVSIGMPGDHHVRKSYIDPNKCVSCGLCAPVCPTNAIPLYFEKNLDHYINLGGDYKIEDQNKEIVIKDLCIGCGKCSNICPKDDIISYRHNERQLRELLPKCLEAGAETFELHAAVGEHEITMKEWELINEINPNNFNSMCLDRLNLGNLNLEYRIEEAKLIAKNKIIIQADGYPMSGGADDYNTTLQAISTADVVNKKFNIRLDKKSVQKDGDKVITNKVYRAHGHHQNIYIILSGGTNSHSKKLADLVGVRCNGIAIGTFARNIIEKYIDNPNFYNDFELIKSAYSTAKELVTANIGEINE
jgi:ferredoxin